MSLHAKKTWKLVKTWARKGNPNATHCEVLLEAEFWRVRGRTDLADKHYKAAIILSGRNGFVQVRSWILFSHYDMHVDSQLCLRPRAPSMFAAKDAAIANEPVNSSATTGKTKRQPRSRFKKQ